MFCFAVDSFFSLFHPSRQKFLFFIVIFQTLLQPANPYVCESSFCFGIMNIFVFFSSVSLSACAVKKYYLFMAVNSVDVLYLFHFFFVSDSIIHATMKIHHPKLCFQTLPTRDETLQYMMDPFLGAAPT